MFDKNKFAQILKNINETYNSQRDFAKKSGINRTYLSQYMNIKLDEPPKPNILKKIADNSNGIVSYYELMIICGYVDSDNIDIDKLIDNFFDTHPDVQFSMSYQDLKNRTLEENIVLNNLFRNYRNIILQSKDLRISYDVFVKDLPALSKTKVNIIWGIYITHLTELVNKFNSTENINRATNKNNTLLSTSTKFYMCPVYGQISAGQPNWVEENIEGRLPIDTDLMDIYNPEEYFFLRVNGESMNKVIKNGAFALIHKQETVENGEIAVVLVNGYDATLKKFTKQGDLIILEPNSTDESFETQVYDKTTSIKILGKYVGKLEINK